MLHHHNLTFGLLTCAKNSRAGGRLVNYMFNWLVRVTWRRALSVKL